MAIVSEGCETKFFVLSGQRKAIIGGRFGVEPVLPKFVHPPAAVDTAESQDVFGTWLLAKKDTGLPEDNKKRGHFFLGTTEVRREHVLLARDGAKEGEKPAEVLNRAVALARYRNAASARLTRDALLRNLDIAEKLGGPGEPRLAEMKRGERATVT